VILAGLLAGCGGSDGPTRYDVSGSVSYDGKPVPKGFITFIPDTDQGNTGPGGGAVIENGHYETESGKGVVGGPHIIRITGYDGKPTQMSGEDMPDGQPIFQTYQTTFDFPKEDTEKDFTVPAGPPAR
jgi:hypothetical protein